MIGRLLRCLGAWLWSMYLLLIIAVSVALIVGTEYRLDVRTSSQTVPGLRLQNVSCRDGHIGLQRVEHLAALAQPRVSTVEEWSIPGLRWGGVIRSDSGNGRSPAAPGMDEVAMVLSVEWWLLMGVLLLPPLGWLLGSMLLGAWQRGKRAAAGSPGLPRSDRSRAAIVLFNLAAAASLVFMFGLALLTRDQTSDSIDFKAELFDGEPWIGTAFWAEGELWFTGPSFDDAPPIDGAQIFPGFRFHRNTPEFGLQVSAWLLWPTAALLPLLSVIFALTRRNVFPPGCCPRCGYDLRASSGGCPECGTARSRHDGGLTA